MDADSKAVLAPVPGDAAAAVVVLGGPGAKHDLAAALKRLPTVRAGSTRDRNGSCGRRQLRRVFWKCSDRDVVGQKLHRY